MLRFFYNLEPNSSIMKNLVLVTALTILLFPACSKSSQIDKIINTAESIIMKHPDSALKMLDKIDI